MAREIFTPDLAFKHEKRPDCEVRPFLRFLTLEAKSGVQTIYDSLWY